MTGLILLYYGACHSIGLASLVASFIAARILRGPRDRRFALLAASLALIVLPGPAEDCPSSRWTLFG